MHFFRQIVKIIGILMTYPIISNSAQHSIIFEDMFSNENSLSKWSVSHFRGDASMTMSTICEEGNSCAKLSIHGQGYIVDTFYTSLPAISNIQKKLEITFRYKATRALPVFISISGNFGCMDPYIRELITLEGDGQWHKASVLLDLRWMLNSSCVLEFLVDNVGLNNTKDGDFILLDDVKVNSYVPPKQTVPAVRWRSPGSMLLIDKTSSQTILLDLIVPEKKTSLFDIDVQSAATGKHVYQHSEKVADGQKTISIDAAKFPVGSYNVAVSSDGKETGQWTFEKYPYRKNAVWVQDGVPYLNGEPFLILGLYHSSDAVLKIVNGKTFKNHPGEVMKDLYNSSEAKESTSDDAWTRARMFKGMSDRGFNTAFYSWGVAPASYFREADRYGLKVVCESQNLFDEIEKVKNQPNILGWYGLDEATPRMAAHCAEIYQQYKKVDPYHPVMAAFCFGGFGYGDHRMVDFVMPDPYPFRSADADFGLKVQYHMESDNEGLIRRDPSTCIIYIPQLFTCDSWAGYLPTIEQIRAEVYAAIYYGAKGFFYYAMYTHEPFAKGMPMNPDRKYWFLPESPLWNEIGPLNRELISMKDMILSGKVDPTITVKAAGTVLGHGLVLPNKRQYILLVNTGPNSQKGIKIYGLKSSQEMKPQCNSPATKFISSGVNVVDLKGYGVGIYLVKDSSSTVTMGK